MKKMKLYGLCLALALVLSACGGKGTAETTAEETTVVETVAEETAKEENTVEETMAEEIAAEETTPEETAVEETAAEVNYDISWAGNEFEKLIPQPPFDGWKGEQKSDSEYEMVTSEANADGSGKYYDEFEAYALSLKDLGFEVEGEFNEFTIKDSAGNTIELLCGDGHAWITIHKASK